MLLQPNCIGEHLLGIGVGLAIAEHQRLIEAPVAHGALRIDANALLKGAGGFVVPEVVQQAEALVEPGLRLGRRRDSDMAVADAGHLEWGGQ
jgi:hypothetical protein